MTSSVVLLFPFLLNSAFPTPSIYVVIGTDTGSWSVDGVYGVYGVYEEKREPELHYKRVGGAGYDGDHRFLYTDSRHHQTWILGYGKTLSTAGAVHNVLIQGSVVVIRQFLIFINQTFLMVSVALVTMVD